MKLIIFLLIVLVIFFSIKYAKHIDGEKAINEKKPQPNTSPDSPISFGYKTSWYAVKTNEYNKLIKIFGIKNTQSSNWEFGLNASYNKNLFITPQLNGWIFIIGANLTCGDSKIGVEKVKQKLIQLSSEFEHAYFFSSHRIVGFYNWGKAENGQIKRFYSHLDETGEVIEDYGEKTEVELTLFSDSSYNIDEEDVLKVTANWCIPLNNLDEEFNAEKCLGIIGELI